jgi:hypothetical protein
MMRTVLMASVGNLVRLQKNIQDYPVNITDTNEEGYSLLSVAIKFGRANILSWLVADGRLVLGAINSTTDTSPWYVLVHHFGQAARQRDPSLNWYAREKSLGMLLRIMMLQVDPATGTYCLALEFPEQTNVISDGLRLRQKQVAGDTVPLEDIRDYLDGTAKPGYLLTNGKRRSTPVFPTPRPAPTRTTTVRQRLQKKITKF